MQSMEENNDERAIVEMRKTKRETKREMESFRRDMQELRLTPEDAQDRIFWTEHSGNQEFGPLTSHSGKR